MAKIPAIFGSARSNLFSSPSTGLGIVPTSTVAPMATYSLATFAYLRPDFRIRFGATGLTLTWSGVDATVAGDIFVLPMSNLDAGLVATLTNTSGLSQAVTLPASQGDIPGTAVVDLSGLTLASRKAASWSLVITGNSANVTFGAAVGLYGPKTSFLGIAAGDNFQWDWEESETWAVEETKNKFLTTFEIDNGARERTVKITILVNELDHPGGVAAIRTWFRQNHGAGRPGVLWLDPNVNDALFGRFVQPLVIRHRWPNVREITMTFVERSKGIKPL